jgi:hypothetical protein
LNRVKSPDSKFILGFFALKLPDITDSEQQIWFSEKP